MFLSFPRVFAFAGEFIFKRKQIRKVQSTKLEQITADRMEIREKNDVPGLCKLSVRSFYVYHTRKLSFFHVKSSLLNENVFPFDNCHVYNPRYLQIHTLFFFYYAPPAWVTD